MKATVTYIEQKFSEFNRLMFGGKLPMLPIELSDAKTFLGVCVYNKRVMPDGKVKHYNFRLRINTRIDLPERVVEDTIIHEMIHYYIGYFELEDLSAHGPLFCQIMDDINERFGRHVAISHKGTHEQNEQAYGSQSRLHTVAAVIFRDGTAGVKVLPRVPYKILYYYNKVSALESVKEVKLYSSLNPFFNQFPNSAALKVNRVNPEELFEQLKDEMEIECDGRDLFIDGVKITDHTSAERAAQADSRPRSRYHVIAVLKLADGHTGVKVLPRVGPTILKYYNGMMRSDEICSVELYLSNSAYFEKYPNSGSLYYHPEDETRVMEQLKNAEHLGCDGIRIARGR